MAETKKKSIWKRWYMIVLYCFIGLIILSAFLPDTETDNSSQRDLTDNSNTQDARTTPTQTTTPQTSTPVAEEKTDTATIGEKNALRKALSYLKYMPFSYSGLVKQLEFEGYTYKESVYGADNSGADWNKQAALKAKSYLDYMAFSRDGLIEQLEFEGFTREQAEYGAQAVGY